MPKVLIPMADYGHDPTEVAIPYSVFQEAGFDIDFVTEKGVSPQCDSKMLEGTTGSLLGADATAKSAYEKMFSSATNRNGSILIPFSWTNADFSMDSYDLLFLPGGHDKGVRQIIDSEIIQNHIAKFFPKTSKKVGQTEKKTVAAICHGVQILAFTPDQSSAVEKYPISAEGNIQKSGFKSIIHGCKTTALPGYMESSIYQATRLFLGDYYKTYGGSTPNVEDFVKAGLDDPAQFQPGPAWYSGSAGSPFIVEDESYRYLSGRFPPDAETLASRAIEMVQEAIV